MAGTGDGRWSTDAHGVRVFTRWWMIDAADGLVVMIHNVADHSGRFAGVAAELNRAGFAVVALDLRGHGESGQASSRGLLGMRGGRAILDDVHRLRVEASSRVGNVPVFVLGHGVGSSIGLAYLTHHSAGLAGAVLCSMPTGIDDFEPLARVLQAAVEDGRRDEPVTDEFGSLNTAFEPARTPFDWLSRDPAAVDAYIADPCCGDDLPLTFGYLIDLFDVVAPARAHLDEIVCPVFNIAGDHDTAGAMGAHPAALASALVGVGVEVDTTLYPGARFDLLHETNADEVVADIAAWLRRRSVPTRVG